MTHPPVVFLDIDGVLNHKVLYRAMESRRGNNTPVDWLDPVCIRRLDAFCAAVGAVVVISSSWRTYGPEKGHPGEPYEWAAEILASAGLRAKIIDGTPDKAEKHGSLWLGSTRWTESRAWLDAHPKVTRWVIFDDVDLEGIPGEWFVRFVRTDIAVGLTDRDVACAVAALDATPAPT